MKKSQVFYYRLFICMLLSFCLTSYVFAQNESSLATRLSTKQSYFPRWITEKNKEGYDFVSMKSYNGNAFAINLQADISKELERDLVDYYLLGTGHIIKKLEASFVYPLAEDLSDTSSSQLLKNTHIMLTALETNLSKLLGFTISLSEKERLEFIQHAIRRESFTITKSLYTLKILDDSYPSYIDCRLPISVDIGITLNKSVQIDIGKTLGTLPDEDISLSLLKDLNFSTNEISREVSDSWFDNLSKRSFHFEGKKNLPADKEPQLYSFGICRMIAGERLNQFDKRELKSSYHAVWAVDTETLYNDFNGTINKIKADCIRVEGLTKCKSNVPELEEALTSIYQWIDPEGSDYNCIQYMFPEELIYSEKYHYILFADRSDHDTHILITIFWE